MINLGRKFTLSANDGKLGLVSNVSYRERQRLQMLSSSRGFSVNAWENSQNNTGGTNVGMTQTSSNVTRAYLEDIFVEDPRIKRKIFRDLYYHDPICGSAADVYSTIPFSDFHLMGIRDKQVLDVYHQSLENMHLASLLPGLSLDYLVLGAFIGSSIFDPVKRIYKGVIPANIDNVEYVAIPIFGIDPLMDLLVPKELLTLLASKDPRVQKLTANIPPEFIESLKKGKIALDPENTIYIQRNTMTAETYGVSFYERVLPITIIEKSLFRGTIDAASRRQRAMLHVVVGGDDEWIPTQDDLQAYRDLVLQADMDPTGAVLVTRTGINMQEIRCLSGDTLVETPKGNIRLDSILPSELVPFSREIDLVVKTLDGSWVNVSHFNYQGIQDSLEIKTKNGKIVCSPEHKNLVLTKNYSFGLRKAKELRVGDFLCKHEGDMKQFFDSFSFCLSQTNTKRSVLKTMFDNGIIIEEITEIKKGLPIPMYDLTIKQEHKNPPLFLINGGYITKNSAQDFWQVDQISDYAAALKYRAFGLSEGILMGETSLSTLDASLSIMLDNIRSYRAKIQRELMYEKIFPNLAIANDFTKKRYMVTGSEDNKENELQDINGNPYRICSSTRSQVVIGDMSVDTDDLLFPKIVWHKQLAPEGDQTYLTILSDMQNFGIPIPMSILAASAGLDINEIISGSKEDMKIRTKLAQMNQQIAEIAQEYGANDQQQDQDSQYQAQAKMMEIAAKSAAGYSVPKRVSLADRQFGPDAEIGSIDSNGKRRDMSQKGKKVLQERVLKVAAEALANRAQRENRKTKDNKKENPKPFVHGVYGKL